MHHRVINVMGRNGISMKALIIIVSMFVFYLQGCAVVKPWEREDLADPILIMDENPIEKGILQHHLDYREGSTGGEGAQGGGCGCG